MVMTTTTTTTYTVSGMTCGHCVSAVSDEVSRLPGVRDVVIELVPGGESSVTVTSEAPLPAQAVRDAVDEAGYEVTGVTG
jgi:copper chaperone